MVVLVFLDSHAQLLDDLAGPRGIGWRLRAHFRHVHVETVRVHAPSRHIVDGVDFVGLGIVHLHAGHFAMVHGPRLPAGRLLGILDRHRGRTMARNGGKEDTYEKKCAE